MRLFAASTTIVFLSSLLSFASESSLTTKDSLTITHHKAAEEKFRSREGIVENKTEVSDQVVTRYWHAWTATFPERWFSGLKRDRRKLIAKIWDRTTKDFPGHNSPIVEVFEGEKRLNCQILAEVAMATDIWVDRFNGHDHLYVKSEFRNRLLPGTVVYRFNRESLEFEYGGVVFQKDDVAKESAARQARANKPLRQTDK